MLRDIVLDFIDKYIAINYSFVLVKISYTTVTSLMLYKGI